MWHCLVIPKHMKLGALASGDAKKRKKKNLFYILKYHLIDFTNLFYNSPNISVLIFTYNLIYGLI